MTSGREMYTFIELQGFSKRRQEHLPDDEFRAFQEVLIEDPEAGAGVTLRFCNSHMGEV